MTSTAIRRRMPRASTWGRASGDQSPAPSIPRAGPISSASRPPSRVNSPCNELGDPNYVEDLASRPTYSTMNRVARRLRRPDTVAGLSLSASSPARPTIEIEMQGRDGGTAGLIRRRDRADRRDVRRSDRDHTGPGNGSILGALATRRGCRRLRLPGRLNRAGHRAVRTN